MTFQLAAVISTCLSLSIVPHSIEERVAESDVVALVRVDTLRNERSEKFPKTVARVTVFEMLKGAPSKEIDIVQIGAVLDGVDTRIPGDAQLVLGEKALVFLKCNGAKNRCGLVAFEFGKMDVRGDTVRFRDVGAIESQQMPLKDMMARIRAALSKGTAR